MADGILNRALPNISVVDSIFQVIIEAITNGEIKPGDRLPTEVELCRDLQVGRNSVREAIKKLEAYGIVYIRRAEGTFVSEKYNQKMLDPMLYGIILQKNGWNDFIDLRRVVDIGTLYLVVRQDDLEQWIPSLEQAADRLEACMKKRRVLLDEVMTADTDFHSVIAKATKNEMIISITEYVTRITIVSRKKTVQMVLDSGEVENFIELHRQMLQVIKNRQVDQIERAVLDHYVYWKKDTPD